MTDIIKDEDLPRVLFLHRINGGPTGSVQRLIQRSVGRGKFMAPDLKSRKLLFLYTVAFAVFIVMQFVCTVLFWLYLSRLYASLLTGTAIVLCVTAYCLGGRGLSTLILRTALREATEAFRRFRPQVIAASSFGAVVALHMDIPKMPMILFSPAQEMYQRYIRSDQEMSLRSYPYTLIVHGSRDSVVPLQDSIHLVETSELGRCRLEVVDDDNKLHSLTQQEVSIWIEEVFKRGRANVQMLAAEGDKTVDPTLFETPNLEAGEPQREETNKPFEGSDAGSDDETASFGEASAVPKDNAHNRGSGSSASTDADATGP
ncbi:hypothetical protein BESB_004340 [Besnoitia besnoiti]|uniref:Transmembrane protein n=1 Tax=Besnoitia besnoiti TaxID=94643 RepID=A0A2A9MPS1_BESBE|nr:hypothetical protein BESB_004340 [Besnoitia besnoiti]PFH38093.1 hypothetical protein BESB_004340 [Besnoitia besnoiti]